MERTRREKVCLGLPIVNRCTGRALRSCNGSAQKDTGMDEERSGQEKIITQTLRRHTIGASISLSAIRSKDFELRICSIYLSMQFAGAVVHFTGAVLVSYTKSGKV